MNIKLLNPQLKTWNPSIHPPLGLAYIAATLEKVGHTVKIIDMGSKIISDKKLIEELVSSDIIGITGMITTRNEVVRLANLSKQVNPRAKVILGGALATTQARDVLLSSQADYAVIGEGEKVVINLVSAIESKKDTSGIKGIAYKTNDTVSINSREENIEDVDAIPFPARHLLDMQSYTSNYYRGHGKEYRKVKSTTIFTSRGCPYSCVFCFHNVWGHKWRGRSPDNIISEIKLLQRDYGFDGFLFCDDTFVLDRKRVMELCQKIQEEKLDIVWHCNARVNLMSEELIKAMSQAGCVGITYGIESGNQQVLDSIRKGITLEQIERATALTKQAGIRTVGLFMLGLLGETKTTIQETLDFARKLNLDFYEFTVTVPLVGTPLYDMARDKGLVSLENINDWHYSINANLTEDCTRKELEQFSKMAFKEFTLEKVYGRHYLLNPRLWLDGFRSLQFQASKKSNREMVKKIFGIITGR